MDLEKDLLERATRAVANSTWHRGFVFAGASGTRIWDKGGRTYLDFAVGPGAANLGWNNPEVNEALAGCVSSNSSGYGGNEILSAAWIELAERLVKLTPGTFSKRVFPSNSGGEAVEAGMVAAVLRSPERRGVFTFTGDFHGRMGLGRIGTSSKPIHVNGIPYALTPYYYHFPAQSHEDPNLQWFSKLPSRYMEMFKAQMDRFIDNVNVALIELVQGEGGINIGHPYILRELVKYFKEHAVYVFVDEVQTGIGRTGELWASEHYGVEPDIMASAKALGNGLMPIGATILHEDLDFEESRGHSNTFGGNPQAAVVALKVLEIIERDNVLGHATAMGAYFKNTLQSKVSSLTDVVQRVDGLGLMCCISFKDKEGRPSGEIRDRAVEEAEKQGLFLMGAGQSTIRLMPPLTVTHAEIDEAIDILVNSIKAVNRQTSRA